jgi:hypothetical protein
MNAENQKAGPVLRPLSGEAEVDSWWHAIVKAWRGYLKWLTR